MRLYVGNLPWTVGRRELKEHFSHFGRVLTSIVVFNKETGFSKGYGFVQFKSEEGFVEAISAQHVLEGRALTVASAGKVQHMDV